MKQGEAYFRCPFVFVELGFGEDGVDLMDCVFGFSDRKHGIFGSDLMDEWKGCEG